MVINMGGTTLSKEVGVTINYNNYKNGYEDKCKEIPKKVITMSMRMLSLKCKETPRKEETSFCCITMPPYEFRKPSPSRLGRR